jgi:hypothetical protein
MPVTKAYVETTVLADALLKPGARASAAKATIGRFSESLLPVYSIKEFKAGPLHHYVWFHGKLVQTKSWGKSLYGSNSSYTLVEYCCRGASSYSTHPS